MRVNAYLKFLVGIAFLLPCLLFGLDDWQPISPEDLKLTTEQAGNADAIIYEKIKSGDEEQIVLQAASAPDKSK